MLPRSGHFGLFCSIVVPELGIPWCNSTSPICHVQQRRQEVLNPRDKIADPRTATDTPCP